MFEYFSNLSQLPTKMEWSALDSAYKFYIWFGITNEEKVLATDFKHLMMFKSNEQHLTSNGSKRDKPESLVKHQ